MASANAGSAQEGVALIGGSLALPGGSTGRAAKNSAGGGAIALKILISSVFLALSLYVSLDFTRPNGHVATLWLGVGLQLGVLLLVPRRQWTAYIAAFFVTNIVVMWLFGCPTAMTIGSGISNCLEALVAGLFLSRDPEWVEGRADRPAAWAKFAIIAVVLLPATAAVTGTFLFDALIHAEANIKDAQETWLTWYVGDALGIAVLTPMILRLRPRQLAALRRRGRILEAVALVGAFGAFALVVFLQGGVLALFLILPPLIILLYRIGFVGLAAGMGIFVPLALAVTMAGRGPFVDMADGDVARAVVLCQAFSMLTFGIVVLVGALLDDRHRLYKVTEDRHGELRRELEAAAMIQAALLPGTKTIGCVTCSGLFLPSSVVAGDTYDVLERADGRIAFFLLDVSGHGAPAALVSVAAHHSLAQAALTHARAQGLDEVVGDIGAELARKSALLYDDLRRAGSRDGKGRLRPGGTSPAAASGSGRLGHGPWRQRLPHRPGRRDLP